VLIGQAGEWVDEKTGRWRIGGLIIALLIGIAMPTWITTTAPEVARQSAGGCALTQQRQRASGSQRSKSGCMRNALH
jgi:hypothetical protein